jgi:hypothetical protein
VNKSSQPVMIHWILKIAQLDWEKILNNGISQDSALSLSLFSSTSPDSITGPSANPSISQVLELAGNSGGSLGPVPSSLLVTLNTGLIGQPAVGSQNLAVIGPNVPVGSTAMANNGNGLLPNLGNRSAMDWDQWLTNEEDLADVDLVGQNLIPNDRSVVQAQVDIPSCPEPGVDHARDDRIALRRTEWLTQLAGRLQKWLAPTESSDENSINSQAPLLARQLVQSPSRREHMSQHPEDRADRKRAAAHADLGATACMILVGGAACRLRRPLLNWWRAKGKLTSHREKTARPQLHRGPHIPSVRARPTSRSGRVKVSH